MEQALALTKGRVLNGYMPFLNAVFVIHAVMRV